MAKRGRTASVDKLLARLKELDGERLAIMAGIKAAVGHILGHESQNRTETRKKTAKVKPFEAPAAKVKAPVRKRAPMSAEARAKIAAAQRRRWAKQKKAAQ